MLWTDYVQKGSVGCRLKINLTKYYARIGGLVRDTRRDETSLFLSHMVGSSIGKDKRFSISKDGFDSLTHYNGTQTDKA